MRKGAAVAVGLFLGLSAGAIGLAAFGSLRGDMFRLMLGCGIAAFAVVLLIVQAEHERRDRPAGAARVSVLRRRAPLWFTLLVFSVAAIVVLGFVHVIRTPAGIVVTRKEAWALEGTFLDLP